jgi:hypothetical protein
MAPRRVTRGGPQSGVGQWRGCFDRARVLLRRMHPATGSHLPLEDTAPPFAVHSHRRLSRIPSRKVTVARRFVQRFLNIGKQGKRQ